MPAATAPFSSICGSPTRRPRGRPREFDREQTERYLTVIQEQGVRLTDLLDHFLDSESVESGCNTPRVRASA